MKVRESGMPDEEVWNRFFNVELILKELQINKQIQTLAEIGTGYGTFTLPVADKIGGLIHSYEIDSKLFEYVQKKCIDQIKLNVKLHNADVLAEGTSLPDNSVDYVMLFNILHNEKPLYLINEAKRILKKNGMIGIIHWRTDIETPRGPSLNIRPNAIEIIEWLKLAHMQVVKQPFMLKPYHYGLVSMK